MDHGSFIILMNINAKRGSTHPCHPRSVERKHISILPES